MLSAKRLTSKYFQQISIPCQLCCLKRMISILKSALRLFRNNLHKLLQNTTQLRKERPNSSNKDLTGQETPLERKRRCIATRLLGLIKQRMIIVNWKEFITLNHSRRKILNFIVQQKNTKRVNHDQISSNYVPVQSDKNINKTKYK